MRRLIAYLTEMRSAGLTHDTVEQLIRGGGPSDGSERELADLLTAIRESAPTPAAKPDFAASLAKVAVSGSHQFTRPRRVLAMGVAAAALFASAGVAAAADGSYPGQVLHGVDRALERIGIGNGGSEERLIEIKALLDEGKHREAEAQLTELGIQATPFDPPSGQADSVAEFVVEKKRFIEENKGPGVGVDGRDFGEDVADLAPGHQMTPPGQKKDNATEPDEATSGPSPAESQADTTGPDAPGQNAGTPTPRAEETGPPEDAGPPEKAKAPDHAGPPEHAGPPAHAGPKKDSGN